jgi:hypothetical protein
MGGFEEIPMIAGHIAEMVQRGWTITFPAAAFDKMVIRATRCEIVHEQGWNEHDGSAFEAIERLTRLTSDSDQGNKLMGKEIKVDNRSTDQRLMELEIKMELLQRQVGEYDGAFMRVGQFIETVGKAACDANKPEPEEKK